MIPEPLTEEERCTLIKLAREALEAGVSGVPLSKLDFSTLSYRLQQPGATFVTLTRKGELRGCIGTLEAQIALAEDVRQHAVAAALNDYRFPPVNPSEIQEIEIEVSYLTCPVPLHYDDPADLMRKLRPCIDGVLIRDGWHRATFLPQVWEKIPDPADFLSHLCMKMGRPPDIWRKQPLEIYIYQVEEMHEHTG